MSVRLDPLDALPRPLLVVLFIVLAVGLLLGRRWARRGYLWLSLAVFVWNLRDLFGATLIRYLIKLPLGSGLALALACWILRRPALLAYFGEQRVAASWRRLDWHKVPLDLLLAGLLFLLLAVHRVLTSSGQIHKLYF